MLETKFRTLAMILYPTIICKPFKISKTYLLLLQQTYNVHEKVKFSSHLTDSTLYLNCEDELVNAIYGDSTHFEKHMKHVCIFYGQNVEFCIAKTAEFLLVLVSAAILGFEPSRTAPILLYNGSGSLQKLPSL
jgi:hypothetical protein